LAANANATLTIIARVDSLQPVTNVAEVVSSGTFDPNSTPNNNNPAENDQASVLITPQAADLSITKTVDNSAPTNGAAIAYTITVSNAGPSAATAVIVNDRLPAGLTFISSTPSAGTYDATTGVWTVGTINAASNANLIIRATYNATGNALTNLASVSSNIADPNNANNVASVAISNAGPDLALTKSHVGNFTVGSQGTFSLRVSNIGGSPTTGTVTLTDTLPAGLTPEPASGAFNNNGWNCNVTGQVVSCTRADVLAPAASYPTLIVTVQVLASAPASVSNTASVSGGGDTVNSNNNATDITTVIPPGTFAPPIGIKRGVAVDNIVTWTIVWINNGNTTANRVRVTDPMPNGSLFSAGSLTCVPNGATTVQSCNYNAATQQIEVEANIAPDPAAATNAQTANNELVITFSTALVSPTGTSLTNQALANWDANGSGSVTDEISANQRAVVTDDPTTAAAGDATSVTATPIAPIPAPTLSPLAMGILMLLLAFSGLYARRRSAVKSSAGYVD
jgi:uncharacterized repeat protein (TIGR01451 family)